MIDVLLISNTAKNIQISWRHFCTKDYNASSAINNDTAIKNLKNGKKGIIPVYYCGNDTHSFIDFYRKLRADEKTANTPLVVLADFKWTKVLSEYVHLVNTYVTGATINDAKLSEIMKNAARSGFEKKAPSRPVLQRRPR